MRLLAVLALACRASATPIKTLQPESETTGCGECMDDSWERTQAVGEGETIESVDVAVSYCSHDLTWLQDYLEDLRSLGAPLRNVTIYSKCGGVVPAPTASGTIWATAWNQTVVNLPNVGRCDHTYAYHMSDMYWNLADVTIFIKDSYDPNSPQSNRVAEGLDQPRDVDYTWKYIKSNGVTCLYDSGASHGASVWHVADVLSGWKLAGYGAEMLAKRLWGKPEEHSQGDDPLQASFLERQTVTVNHQTVPAFALPVAFQSPVRPLGAWLKQTMGIDLAERNLWPVCYGGLFAASKKSIHRTEKPRWEQLRDSLTRGDNIEEGHYAERSWLGLLSNKIAASHEDKLRNAAQGTCGTDNTIGSCLAGQLMSCDCKLLANLNVTIGAGVLPLQPPVNVASCESCGSCWCK
jgi:hypothetical protein